MKDEPRVVSDRFAEKVAVVTSGASGIGEAIVRGLLAEGASVVIGDVNRERTEIREKEFGGNRLAGIIADVRVEADVEALVRTGVERFGGVDLGFNVAGLGRGAPIIEQTEEDWRFVIDVCLTGVFLSMKHEARAMTQSGGGAIVNISTWPATTPATSPASICSLMAGGNKQATRTSGPT